MANDALSRTGLYPINQPNGNVKGRYYKANTAQAIYRFQPVALNNSGQIAVAAIGDNVQILGSALGFLDANKAALPSALETTSAAAFLPASTDGFVFVSDDPNQEYLLEADTGGTALTQAEIGTSCGFTYTATTGNTTTGIANVLLDRSDAAADTGGSFRILALADNVNSDGTMNDFGNFDKYIVVIAHKQNGQSSFSVNV